MLRQSHTCLSGTSSRRSRDIALLDRVYEHVTLPPLIVAAIDTPYVQRLRGLKQLGASSYLYPGAVHTRFEHSIGVAHLARQFLLTIADKQPELGITQTDVEVAMMAGLLHDVGHGPFSHLFEDVITRRAGAGGNSNSGDGNNNGTTNTTTNASTVHNNSPFVHEDMSERIMLKMLRDDLKLDDGFIAKTVALVRGKKAAPSKQEGTDPTTTQTITPPYWELISNKRNGIDVDRLDYLFRDSLCCFGKPTIDVRVNRLFNAARIVKVGTPTNTSAANGSTNSNSTAEAPQPNASPSASFEYRLAFESKMAVNIREVFGLRAKLHKSVYQHHVVKAVGHMIGDVLALAAPQLRIAGGKTMMECCSDVDDFCLLGDWVLDAVAADGNPLLGPAKALLYRLRTRDLYTLAGSANIHPVVATNTNTNNVKLTEETILAMLNECAKTMGLWDGASPTTQWDPAKVVVDVVVINHGKGAKDPLQYVDFFNPKDDPIVGDIGLPLHRDIDSKHPTTTTTTPLTGGLADTTRLFGLTGSSPLLSPSAFEERTIMVFAKERGMVKSVRAVFDQWCGGGEVAGRLYEGLSFHNPRQ